MNKRPLQLLLLLGAVITWLGCSRNQDIGKLQLKQGTYILSDKIYFDAARLYTKQNITTDTNLIGKAINHFDQYMAWGDIIDGFITDSIKNGFDLSHTSNTWDPPLAKSFLKIMPGPSAVLLNFPGMKDTVPCDIMANNNGTFTLTQKDSSEVYASDCWGLELAMLNIANFRKYAINIGVGKTAVIYKGRNRFLIDIENGQINVHGASLFIYSKKGCWHYLKNVLKIYSPPAPDKLSVGDTILIQEKKFVFNPVSP